MNLTFSALKFYAINAQKAMFLGLTSLALSWIVPFLVISFSTETVAGLIYCAAICSVIVSYALADFLGSWESEDYVVNQMDKSDLLSANFCREIFYANLYFAVGVSIGTFLFTLF